MSPRFGVGPPLLRLPLLPVHLLIIAGRWRVAGRSSWVTRGLPKVPEAGQRTAGDRLHYVLLLGGDEDVRHLRARAQLNRMVTRPGRAGRDCRNPGTPGATVVHVLTRWAKRMPSSRWMIGILVTAVVVAVGWALFVPIADWLAARLTPSAP